MPRFDRASQRTYFRCDLRPVYVRFLPRTNQPPATTTFAHLLTYGYAVRTASTFTELYVPVVVFLFFSALQPCQATRPCELLFRTHSDASYDASHDAYGPPLVPILQ